MLKQLPRLLADPFATTDCEDGRHTPVLTGRTDLPAAEVACRVFNAHQLATEPLLRRGLLDSPGL